MAAKSKRVAKLTAEEGAGKGRPRPLPGSQTLVRGLYVLDAVASGATSLMALAGVLKMNRSTTYRLASTLVEHRYLSFTPRVGYALGPKLLELGYLARDLMSFPRVARDHINRWRPRRAIPCIWAYWMAPAPCTSTRCPAAGGSRFAPISVTGIPCGLRAWARL